MIKSLRKINIFNKGFIFLQSLYKFIRNDIFQEIKFINIIFIVKYQIHNLLPKSLYINSLKLLNPLRICLKLIKIIKMKLIDKIMEILKIILQTSIHAIEIEIKIMIQINKIQIKEVDIDSLFRFIILL